MEHVMLKEKNSGKLPEMKGKVGLFYLLINTPDAKWDTASKNAFVNEIRKAAAFFEREAAKKGVYLRIISTVAHGSASRAVSLNDGVAAQRKELAGAARFSDMDSMRNAYKAKYGVDVAMFCFAFRTEGRAFARGTHTVVFKDAKENVIMHEFCHLFGAKDLYYHELLWKKARQHFGKSTMLSSSEMVIDPLTAYLIGWDKVPDRAASAFLRSTAALTNEQLAAADEAQTKTGYGTVRTEYGVYTGYLVNGFSHGFGTWISNSGGHYEGEWKNNEKDGKGKYCYPNGGRYEGEWKNDKKDGKGKYCYPNGSRYEGEWKDGEINGKGTYYYAGGSRYEGEWKDGLRNGKGTYYYPGGSRHVGEWKNDKKNGKGKYFQNNILRYDGEWKDGKENGKGTYYYPDGSHYVGEWKAGEINGKGTYCYAGGSYYEGEWKNGQRNGWGTYCYTDNSRYEGEWKNNEKNGKGTYRYPNGDRYVGEWRDGKQNGRGTYCYADGSRLEGEWRDGKHYGGVTHSYNGGYREKPFWWMPN